jgi:hypothetical protein
MGAGLTLSLHSRGRRPERLTTSVPDAATGFGLTGWEGASLDAFGGSMYHRTQRLELSPFLADLAQPANKQSLGLAIAGLSKVCCAR